jgi:ribosomal protein L16 Arg81 hydroxylase
MESCTELEKIISPIALPLFEEVYFEKKPLLISRNDTSYFRDLVSIELLDQYLERKDIRYPGIRLVKNGLELPQTDYLTNFPYGNKVFDNVIDNDRFFTLFSQGATAVFQAIHKTLPSLSGFCQRIEKYYNFPLQTNIYLTPRSSKGFQAHFDNHDVFVLQVHGSKVWKVYDSPIYLPTETFEKSMLPEHMVPQIEVELKQGDTLYIPRGFVHEAVTTNQVSMHITLGLLSYKWIDVLRLIVNDAHKINGFKESFRFDKLDEQEIEKTIKDLVNQLLSVVDYSNISKKFKTRFIKKGLTSDNNRLLDMIRADEVNAATIFELRNEISYNIAETDAEIILSYYNKQVKFPAYVLATIKAMANSKSFTVEGLNSNIDTAGKLVLCKKLLQEGFLKINDNGN